jgi:hypothetical protein
MVCVIGVSALRVFILFVFFGFSFFSLSVRVRSLFSAFVVVVVVVAAAARSCYLVRKEERQEGKGGPKLEGRDAREATNERDVIAKNPIFFSCLGLLHLRTQDGKIYHRKKEADSLPPSLFLPLFPPHSS